MGALRGEHGGRAPLLGILKDTKKKALEMEHLSLYRGSIRETWRGSSFTENSERHDKEGF
jgi:hypothetical protein